MLVLSRKGDESIMIGDDIVITVVDIKGDKVRLGITAPTSIAIHRKEVYDVIKAEKETAARAKGVPAASRHTCTSSCPPPIKSAPPSSGGSFRSSSSLSATAAA